MPAAGTSTSTPPSGPSPPPRTPASTPTTATPAHLILGRHGRLSDGPEGLGQGPKRPTNPTTTRGDQPRRQDPGFVGRALDAAPEAVTLPAPPARSTPPCGLS